MSRADQSVEGGESALKDLLAEHPDVTAVFAFNDIVAIGALRAARRLGREVPRDLAVIGFDGLQLGRSSSRRCPPWPWTRGRSALSSWNRRRGC